MTRLTLTRERLERALDGAARTWIRRRSVPRRRVFLIDASGSTLRWEGALRALVAGLSDDYRQGDDLTVIAYSNKTVTVMVGHGGSDEELDRMRNIFDAGTLWQGGDEEAALGELQRVLQWYRDQTMDVVWITDGMFQHGQDLIYRMLNHLGIGLLTVTHPSQVEAILERLVAASR